MSLLCWVEHCVECAAPDCYQSCDLYQPRTDLRCRRFTFGAMKNKNFPSLRGYGVEISFKKWAKLEAYGNLSMLPANLALWGEKLIEWGSPAGNLAGRIMAKRSGKPRWLSATMIGLEELVRRFGRGRSTQDAPDVFLLEVYNPMEVRSRLQLSFVPLREMPAEYASPLDQSRAFVTTLDLPAGYSRHQVEMPLLRSVTTSRKGFLVSMVPEADSNARLVFLTADFVKFTAQPAVAQGDKRIKCVVWDLDNTLWEGILAEGDEVVLRPEIVSLFRQLDERGILMSIASKNDYKSALQKLEELGVHEYFVYPQINWGPKSQSVRAVAGRLNLGLDSFAFVDDSPFELDEVARSLPEVTCVPAARIPSLLSDPRFRGSASVESRRRRQLYQEAAVREAACEEFGTDYTGFLASCGMKLEIAPYSHEDSERVAELVQRTNQLNFSGRKYSRAELEELLADASTEKLLLRVSDRFGEYGTVGFAILGHAAGVLRVQDLMLSCRVQGKLVEQALFGHLLAHHNPESAAALWVNFQKTARNRPAEQVLRSLGFRECSESANGDDSGMICSAVDPLDCDFFQVQCSALPQAEVAPTAVGATESARGAEGLKGKTRSAKAG